MRPACGIFARRRAVRGPIVEPQFLLARMYIGKANQHRLEGKKKAIRDWTLWQHHAVTCHGGNLLQHRRDACNTSRTLCELPS